MNKDNLDNLIQSSVSLASQTSYKVGGDAQWYAAPKNWDELEASFDWYQTQDVPLTLLGAGSNLLISDRGLPGLVLSTRYFRSYEFDPRNGYLGCGCGGGDRQIGLESCQTGHERGLNGR